MKHLSLPNRHWLSSAYTQFAVPYFIYDIYAMFLCHWHKHQVKEHGGEARAAGSTWAVVRGYLHKEFLMVLHHAVMVLVCFPLSVVSPPGWPRASALLPAPTPTGTLGGHPWVLAAGCSAREGLLGTPQPLWQEAPASGGRLGSAQLECCPVSLSLLCCAGRSCVLFPQG